jgi:hypothetical protein
MIATIDCRDGDIDGGSGGSGGGAIIASVSANAMMGRTKIHSVALDEK